MGDWKTKPDKWGMNTGTKYELSKEEKKRRKWEKCQDRYKDQEGGEEREGWNPDLRDLDAKDLSERKEQVCKTSSHKQALQGGQREDYILEEKKW